jgi:predicted amidohydrolase
MRGVENFDLLLRDVRVVLPKLSSQTKSDIGVREGKIVALAPGLDRRAPGRLSRVRGGWRFPAWSMPIWTRVRSRRFPS